MFRLLRRELAGAFIQVFQAHPKVIIGIAFNRLPNPFIRITSLGPYDA
jgi:hypothetical protein